MKEFAYARAGDAAEAATLIAQRPDATYLGGGTNLVDLMKLGVTDPGLLIDVSRLPYDRIEHREDGSVLIGATVRNGASAGDPGIRERFPLLSQALLAGASGQLRTVATVGGNLLQRTRCGYFQDVTKPCNKREPGTGCPAIEGAHRDLAVLGTSDHCVASHPSDMAVALVALDAVAHVRSVDGGSRTVPVAELYLLPGDTPHRETVLDHGDLITAVELPPPPRGARMRYRKVRDRWSYAFALVSVAAAVSVAEDGSLRDVRIALGGVAPRPWRARIAEERLRGARPDEETLREAARAELAEARPLPDNAFKVDLATDLIVAGVRDLVARRDRA
ncbi:FAD binding domain-containing protein [Streptomyces rapamycinicus]|uniref:Molybdopterin dehydrogenase n=2 Tax=Streptomyces rapamycinicus TaxID=1226757 RepID=A0A0A0N9D7_STRRN|nr:xanthine dehydrogenase family protein subunit M [Streptomyces rapamycinicus]AGP52718.1 FAD-binding molybdopterin dehydrogenase [Streptomyces rapamycinicus NRRL 5491]MBB4780193.1 xanthine dehydrogenase YagS FAD-binding subunit [Streptomyces rapamycinicus]RLV75152.1 molybdopterin dehydrogenase [Streptomyces rapamycinicus NRRL 5491]UTO60932.1 xanthine dehydrogenase family protein subunit M [Streptomyces rapamycinicus]UTP28876.1 xanthine dehydrogenase family protein subunit M [Streptomyces rapa